MDGLHPPKAPGEQLRMESFRTLTWLRLVFEFRPWLEQMRDHFAQDYDNSVKLLWNCSVLGAPLCTLLDLLGLPTPRPLASTPESFDFDLPLEKRRDYIFYFIDRIRILEIQRQIPYGEVLRVEDFLQSTNAGFSRVLQTVRRLLNALYEIYPGLFAVPRGSRSRRASLFNQLVETEEDHVTKLFSVVDAASQLLAQTNINTAHYALEAFTLSSTRICQFHGQVLIELEKVTPGDDCEPWDDIFLFQDKLFRTSIMSSYRSICANYLSFSDYLERQALTPTVSEHAKVILSNLSDILSRISTYSLLLQSILDLTPIESHTHEMLCGVTVYMNNISRTIEDVGKEIRTMHISQLLKARIGTRDLKRNWNYESFGVVELDDILFGDSMLTQKYHMIVFEKVIICCESIKPTDQNPFQNPIKPWEFGAAFSLPSSSKLRVLHYIPKHCLRELRCIDGTFFELTWEDGTGKPRTLPLYTTIPCQYEQWLFVLRMVVSKVSHWNSILDSNTNDELERSWVFDEDSLRRSSVPKAWSVIGRKGTQSECSSMIIKRHHDSVSLLSPELLPTLFSIRPSSPTESGFQLDIRSSADLGNKAKTIDSGVFIEVKSTLPVADLTGKITKCGNYPVAHGGYSDVWKGSFTRDSSSSSVGVKVFRKMSSDPDSQKKVMKKLHKELEIWHKLDHPNVVPLLGIISNFGPYLSLVCPWFENGSVAKYMEIFGDILSVSDRFKLLCEVSDGLEYLHTCSIIHGDLSGSNILIDSDGNARLCDFGLSSVVEELDNNSYATSSLAGSVRWTDINLYCSSEDETPRVITTKSDIYSFGSVMLELLTGRVPYHYIRTDAQVVIELYQGKKPRRPAASFVDDNQWSLIQKCWADNPDTRPKISEVRSSVLSLYKKSLCI